jgi:hypothetical protein
MTAPADDPLADVPGDEGVVARVLGDLIACQRANGVRLELIAATVGRLADEVQTLSAAQRDPTTLSIYSGDGATLIATVALPPDWRTRSRPCPFCAEPCQFCVSDAPAAPAV